MPPKPIAMPLHNGVRLDQYQSRPPPNPDGGNDNPEQPISLAKARLYARAGESAELLPKGDILKNQFVMPAASEGERPSEQQNHVEHAVDSVVLRQLNQRSRAAMDFGAGQLH